MGLLMETVPGSRGELEPLPMTWLGIDPGLGGGLCYLYPEGQPSLTKMPLTERDLWDWINAERPGDFPVRAVIERIVPRPTAFFDKQAGHFRQSILKTTCLLYGSYMSLRGMLIAAGIPFEEVDPKAWQAGFKLFGKKGESKTAWKNRLKARAQELQPYCKLTLATADAVLLAHHGRRKGM